MEKDNQGVLRGEFEGRKGLKVDRSRAAVKGRSRAATKGTSRAGQGQQPRAG